MPDVTAGHRHADDILLSRYHAACACQGLECASYYLLSLWPNGEVSIHRQIQIEKPGSFPVAASAIRARAKMPQWTKRWRMFFAGKFANGYSALWCKCAWAAAMNP